MKDVYIYIYTHERIQKHHGSRYLDPPPLSSFRLLQLTPPTRTLQKAHRQPLNGLQLPLQIPQHRRLGRPLPERISQLHNLPPKEIRNPFVRDDVPQRPGYLVVVLLVRRVEGLDEERGGGGGGMGGLFGTLVGEEQVLYR